MLISAKLSGRASTFNDSSLSSGRTVMLILLNRKYGVAAARTANELLLFNNVNSDTAVCAVSGGAVAAALAVAAGVGDSHNGVVKEGSTRWVIWRSLRDSGLGSSTSVTVQLWCKIAREIRCLRPTSIVSPGVGCSYGQS